MYASAKWSLTSKSRLCLAGGKRVIQPATKRSFVLERYFGGYEQDANLMCLYHEAPLRSYPLTGIEERYSQHVYTHITRRRGREMVLSPIFQQQHQTVLGLGYGFDTLIICLQRATDAQSPQHDCLTSGQQSIGSRARCRSHFRSIPI